MRVAGPASTQRTPTRSRIPAAGHVLCEHMCELPQQMGRRPACEHLGLLPGQLLQLLNRCPRGVQAGLALAQAHEDIPRGRRKPIFGSYEQVAACTVQRGCIPCGERIPARGRCPGCRMRGRASTRYLPVGWLGDSRDTKIDADAAARARSRGHKVAVGEVAGTLCRKAATTWSAPPMSSSTLPSR